MKRGIKLLVYLGVLLIAVIAVLVIKEVTKEDDLSSEEQDIIIYTIGDNETAVITWKYKDRDNTLIVKDGRLQSEERSVSLNEANKNAMEESILKVRVVRIIENANDLSSYGLDNPGLSVTITKNGEATTFSFGNQTNTNDDNYYMSTGDGKVYVVTNRFPSAFNIGIDEINMNL